jgi:hypothetical protein
MGEDQFHPGQSAELSDFWHGKCFEERVSQPASVTLRAHSDAGKFLVKERIADAVAIIQRS